MAKDKELADHERAHNGQPGSVVRHGASATQTRYPSSAGGNRLKRVVEEHVRKNPQDSVLGRVTKDLPPESFDRLHDILSGKVSYDH